MAVPIGLHRAAAAKGSTWGTIASDPTTGSLYPISSDTVKQQVELIQSNELRNSGGRQASSAGNKIVEGSWMRDLHYQGEELLQALALGSSSVSQVGTTAYYAHTYTASSNLDGLFASLFMDREQSTWEVDSAKVNSMTISGSQGDRVEVEYEFMGRDLDRAGDIAFGSCTEASEARNNFVLFSDLTWYVNDNSGGDVTSESEIGISDFSITFSNNLEAFYTSANAPLIEEPVRSDFIEVSGSLTIPTYEADTHLADIVDKSLRKMAFSFSSGSYSYVINVPGFRWTGDLPEVTGPQRVPLNLSFEYEEATSNPTGMSDTLPYVVVTSQDSTDPLA